MLVFAYVTFGWATGTLPEPLKGWAGVKSVEEHRADAFAKNYSDRLIEFADPDYGFKARYPLGYSAEFEPEYGVRLRVLALVPGFSPELMEVSVVNTSFGEADFKTLSDAVSKEYSVEFAGKKNVFGREFYSINTRNESEFTDEIIYTRQGFYNCRNPQGEAYSAAVVFVVPEAVASDIELADYTLASFEC